MHYPVWRWMPCLRCWWAMVSLHELMLMVAIHPRRWFPMPSFRTIQARRDWPTALLSRPPIIRRRMGASNTMVLMAARPLRTRRVGSHPGGIQTEIARNARIGESECRESTDSTFDKLAKTSPKRAAEIIISGVKSNKARILVGPDAHVIHMLARVLGARYQSLTQLWAKKMIY